ncbi:MAG: hypothetical protein H0V82_06465 [Candidatus Protochlamydia sp.]|nr:hypothetical protein [Candidatus Protochlamydia sp.]
MFNFNEFSNVLSGLKCVSEGVYDYFFQKEATTPVLNLPVDILNIINKDLDLHSFINFSCSSKKMLEFTNNNNEYSPLNKKIQYFAKKIIIEFKPTIYKPVLICDRYLGKGDLDSKWEQVFVKLDKDLTVIDYEIKLICKDDKIINFAKGENFYVREAEVCNYSAIEGEVYEANDKANTFAENLLNKLIN